MSSICLSCSRLSTFSGLLQTLKKWKKLAYISYDPKFQFNCIYLTDQYIVSDILYSEFSIQSLRVSRVQKIRSSQNKQTCLSVYYIILFGTNISYSMEEIYRFLVKALMNNIFKMNVYDMWFMNMTYLIPKRKSVPKFENNFFFPFLHLVKYQLNTATDLM